MSTESQIRMRRFFDLTNYLNVDEIKDLSDQIREKLEADGRETDSLVYGEIAYSAMYELLEMLKEKGIIGGKSGEIFMDLGSGVGKAVVMGAFLHKFEACIGFEVLPELHTMALELFERAQQDTSARLESRLGDYMTEAWPEATVVLSNSTCLTREMFDQLVQKAADSLPTGSVLISMSKAVHSASWLLVEQSQKALHWGICSFYVYTHS
jgi:hypothetical protein